MKANSSHTPLPHNRAVSAGSSAAKMLLTTALFMNLGACQSAGSGSLLSNISGAAVVGEISFRNPPKLNEWLIPQNGLVACESEQLAMTMALTGFFLDTCHTVTHPDQYQVKALDLRELADGHMTWMVEVAGSQGTAWVPLPWHDWV